MAHALKAANWLTAPITPHGLLTIGFESVKKGANNEGLSAVTNSRVTNMSRMEEALYFEPLDVVAYSYEGLWYLSMDSDSDSVWQGKLVTMGDLVSVLILLSK